MHDGTPRSLALEPERGDIIFMAKLKTTHDRGAYRTVGRATDGVVIIAPKVASERFKIGEVRKEFLDLLRRERAGEPAIASSSIESPGKLAKRPSARN